MINLGVPGYDTDNEVNMILARGVALAPDLVIICFFLNDAGGGNIFQALNQESGFVAAIKIGVHIEGLGPSEGVEPVASCHRAVTGRKSTRWPSELSCRPPAERQPK